MQRNEKGNTGRCACREHNSGTDISSGNHPCGSHCRCKNQKKERPEVAQARKPAEENRVYASTTINGINIHVPVSKKLYVHVVEFAKSWKISVEDIVQDAFREPFMERKPLNENHLRLHLEKMAINELRKVTA